MIRNLFASLVVALGLLASAGLAQEIIPANHGGPVVIEGQSCEGGHCGKCVDCVRIPDVKKTTKIIYDSKCKEMCLPFCSLKSLLSGHCGSCESGDCGDCGRHITVHKLMKKACETECPTTRCVPASEAAKYWEAEAKKGVVAAPAPVLVPAPAVAPAPAPVKLPAGALSVPQTVPAVPAALAPQANPSLAPVFADRLRIE